MHKRPGDVPVRLPEPEDPDVLTVSLAGMSYEGVSRALTLHLEWVTGPTRFSVRLVGLQAAQFVGFMGTKVAPEVLLEAARYRALRAHGAYMSPAGKHLIGTEVDAFCDELASGADGAPRMTAETFKLTSNQVARATEPPCDPDTVRNYANRGWVECERLHNGVRLFKPSAVERVTQIRREGLSRRGGRHSPKTAT